MMWTKSMFSSLLVAAGLILVGGGIAEVKGQTVTVFRRRPPDHWRRRVIENSAFVVEGNYVSSPPAAARRVGAEGRRARRPHRQDRDADHDRSARPSRLPERCRRHDVEGHVHPRQPDRSPAAARLSRRRRRGRRRRPGRPRGRPVAAAQIGATFRCGCATNSIPGAAMFRPRRRHGLSRCRRAGARLRGWT